MKNWRNNLADLGSFLTIWFCMWIAFAVIEENAPYLNVLVHSFAITCLVKVVYKMGYEKGTKDIKNGEYKELTKRIVTPFDQL